MYFNALKIYIVSDDTWLEDTIKNCEPPEDCGFEIKTVESSAELEALRHDSAVIADGVDNFDDTLLAYGRKLVIMDSVSALEDADELMLFRADCLWAMPDGVRSEKLATAYFNKLAADMKLEADNRKQTICFNTAIDSIPDLVWFKDEVGSHLIVNDGFCRAVAKSKEQIYKRGHYYIWDIPKEEYEQGEYVCLESEDIVMEARQTCLFDEKVKTKDGMRLFKTYKSPLIDKDGTIFGTCGIAHDVTDLQNVSTEMEVILESMPFAVVIEDVNGIIISANKCFEKYFGSADTILGKSYAQWKKSYIADRFIEVGGREEMRINVGGEERVLVFAEEPLVDIFRERMGSIGIFRDVTMERHFERQTIESANTDFLTGLDNRRSFSAKLGELLQAEQLSLVMLDLDNFKSVNDTYGHHVGDEALVVTAHNLKQSFAGDFIVRLGGDEFLVAVCEQVGDNGIRAKVEKALSNLQRGFLAHENLTKLTSSAGVATACKADGYDIEALMRQSDSALYRAKSSGKNRVYIYGEEF